jgi:hypothetical protein
VKCHSLKKPSAKKVVKKDLAVRGGKDQNLFRPGLEG